MGQSFKLVRHERQEQIQRTIVTAQQMGEIESRIFDAGMPVAALMEKVAMRVAHHIETRYPVNEFPQVGVIVGPGHNGGDGAVVARELHFSGYQVVLHRPLAKLKPLTEGHVNYATSLGIPLVSADELRAINLIVDGLFGFGLTRPITNELADLVNLVNSLPASVVSIDLPSGLHTDTGEVLGTAIRATHTACLGLWKRAFLQDRVLDYVGTPELIDFDIPLADVKAVIGESPRWQRITAAQAIAPLPIPRPPTTYKYREGNLLLVCGSEQYMGAAVLTGLAARASGVGMLTLAIPQALKPVIAMQIPDAVTVGCPETESGAIAHFPDGLTLEKFSAIACGPGLSQDAIQAVKQVLASDRPLVLDADGLNILAHLDPITTLSQRSAPTVLTPHPGEFKRLFPKLAEDLGDRLTAVQQAAQQSGAVVLLKGAMVAIANAEGRGWVNPESTPALARGGSGDVLTGLLGGLLAQAASRQISPDLIAASAAWWHAQAGRQAAQQRGELGVDAQTLVDYLLDRKPESRRQNSGGSWLLAPDS
ncbi:MAG: NAD(P)H-hydrate dehydratase [Synechococcales bacterium]|nr:NAD(P)H-hydrate dehydratase [Synechococcales bacterium]